MGFPIGKGQPPFIPPPPGATNPPSIPDWVPRVDYLNNLGGWVGEPIEFSERDIRLIQSSLPPGTAKSDGWYRTGDTALVGEYPLSGSRADGVARRGGVAQNAIMVTDAERIIGLYRRHARASTNDQRSSPQARRAPWINAAAHFATFFMRIRCRANTGSGVAKCQRRSTRAHSRSSDGNSSIRSGSRHRLRDRGADGPLLDRAGV